MKLESYWQDSAPAFGAAAKARPEGHYDVAVVGGGFTGLAAARALAGSGTRVVVLEAKAVLSGASGRNGGHVNNGLSHSYLAARERFGREGAAALYRAFDAAVDTVERIVAEEKIDCAFRRSGKLKLAAKPAHYDALARNFAALSEEVDPDTALLSRDELRAELGSDAFHGGLLQRRSAMMHVGRFGIGLAEAAARKGAVIHEQAAVTGRQRDSKGRHVLRTGGGQVTADAVLVATGAYTSGPFGWFRRRIVPVGSFILATAPLSEAQAQATLPGRRTYVTSKNIGNYFRLAQDRRLIFGGRARFAASNPESDARSGRILAEALQAIFPQLRSVRLDYCWGGMVDMTRDRFPRAGEVEGLHYAMGYSGHGVQMSVQMGEAMARVMAGTPEANPWRDLDWKAIPGHFGRPWFLPLVGVYYRLLDRLQ